MQADRACEETLAGTEITDLERGRGGECVRKEGRERRRGRGGVCDGCLGWGGRRVELGRRVGERR